MSLENANLRCFIVAANRRSFREAATVLRVRQSSVSRAISRLEDELGVSLFVRHRSGARLTAAGERFLSAVLPACEQLETAQRTAAAAGRAETGIVQVGVLTSLAGGFLRSLLHGYRKLNPGVEIDVHDGSRDSHLAAIQKHALDVAFLTGTERAPYCECAEIWRERVHVALWKDHHLAGRHCLDWDDLRKERFIVSRFAPGMEVQNYIVRRASTCGVRPNIEIKNAGRETLMNLVSLGQGITLVSAAWASAGLPDLVLRPLSDAHDVIPFSAVWSAQNDNPALRRLLSIAHMMSGHARPGTSDWAAPTLGIRRLHDVNA